VTLDVEIAGLDQAKAEEIVKQAHAVCPYHRCGKGQCRRQAERRHAMSGPVAAQEREDDPLLLDRQVCFPLYAATNLLGRLHAPVLGKLGLTYPQYRRAGTVGP
jgi:hypothetical protein